MSTNHDTPGEDEDLLPRLFRALGPSPKLPDAMKHRWESTFARELSIQNTARRRQRRQYFGMACAGVFALTATVLYLHRDAPAEPPVAHVALISGLVESTKAGASQQLHEGAELRAGQTLRVGSHANLAMRYRDTDVRLNSDTVMVLHATRLQLVEGQIYVDAGPTPRPGPTLEIETPFGTLAHVGTQFVVFVSATEMRAAVREGSIAVNAAGDRRIVSAADGPTEAVISSSGTFTTHPMAGVGGIWAWVAGAAPRYTMDGHNADEFFAWATRQLGAQLNYANDATRVHAQTVVLHGDIHTLSVTQGFAVLSATTDLDIDQSDPTVVRIRIRDLTN
jgi:hypothetical protein